MKRINFVLTIAAVLFLSFTVKAQYDDIYYDATRESRSNTRSTQRQSRDYNDQYNDNSSAYDDNNYDREYYEYDDDYDDYYYSSRISRFHRPYRGFGFYDVAYVDYYYYDPFYYNRFWSRPMISFSFGNDYWFNYNRFNRWNSWGWYDRYWNDYCAFNDWRWGGYGNSFFWNTGWNSWGYNSWGYNPWSFNNYYTMNNYYGGWGNRYRNPYYSTANNNNSNTGRTHIYGPRSNGTFGEPNTPSGLRNGSSRDRVITRDGSTTNNAPSNNDRIRRNEYNSRNDRAMPDNNRVNQQRYETVTEDDNTRPSATEGGRTRRNDYDRQNRTIDAQPRVQSENEGNNNRTQQRNYDRPQRVERENRPIDQQRSYEPQRQERQQRSYEPRNDAPRYEPRRESPSYNAPRSEPRQSAPSPSPSQNNGGSRSGGRSGSRN